VTTAPSAQRTGTGPKGPVPALLMCAVDTPRALAGLPDGRQGHRPSSADGSRGPKSPPRWTRRFFDRALAVVIDKQAFVPHPPVPTATASPPCGHPIVPVRMLSATCIAMSRTRSRNSGDAVVAVTIAVQLVGSIGTKS
jgi:hypothetical protein